MAWARAGEAPTLALDGGVCAAGSAMDWAGGLGLFGSLDELQGFDPEPAIARGLASVPALAGLACPHRNRQARGAWMGMGLATTRRDLLQAPLEGLAFRMAEVVEALALPPGQPVSVDGGLTANPWFCATLASALGRSVRVSAEAELTALGAATLATEALGRPGPAAGGGTLVEPRGRLADWRPRIAAAVARVARDGAGG